MIAARTRSGALVSHAVAYNRPDVFPRRELEVVGDRGRALAVNTMGQTPGGRLTLTWTRDDHVLLAGPAEIVARGTTHL